MQLKQIKILLQYFLPHHLISRIYGFWARCKHKKIKEFSIKWYIKRYKVDMSQALEADPYTHENGQAFFIRKLKPELRPIVPGENVICCPNDGSISQFGDIKEGRIFQAKGHDYTVKELLGGKQTHANTFANGQFITLYLAPKDYHRVHMPLTGQLQEMIHVPGRLFSVNPDIVENVPRLFARNERVVSLFNTEFGPMGIVLVGAMIVASIDTVWAGTVTPPHKREVREWHYQNQPLTLAKGEEMGHFNIGSTVILLFANSQLQWANNLAINQTVRLGQLLGNISA